MQGTSHGKRSREDRHDGANLNLAVLLAQLGGEREFRIQRVIVGKPFVARDSRDRAVAEVKQQTLRGWIERGLVIEDLHDERGRVLTVTAEGCEAVLGFLRRRIAS